MAARVLLLGIWTESDDQGVFEWKPVTLKMRIFSADNLDVVPLLEELKVADAIRQFSFEGKSHGAVRNFCKYQKPKTPKFRYVKDDEIRNYVASKYPKEETPPPDPEPFPQKVEMDRQREEGGDSLILGRGNGGGEKNAPAKVFKGASKEEGSCLDSNFQPSAETIETLTSMGFVGEQYQSEFKKFMSYYGSRGAFRTNWNDGLILWFQRAKPDPVAKPSKAAAKKIHVKVDTPQWKAWCDHLGKIPPTDRNFGWSFESEWPPGYELARSA